MPVRIQFKELNSTLNREVAAFERARAAGTHTLGGSPGFGAPESTLEAEAQEHVLGLGGSHVLGGGGASGAGDSPHERRRKVLEAAMARLRKEEEELEDRCGTTGH